MPILRALFQQTPSLRPAFLPLRHASLPLRRRLLRPSRSLSTGRHPPSANPINSPKPPTNPSLTVRPLRRLLKSVATLVLAYPALDFFFTNVFQIMTVTGPSMYPFLNTDVHSSLSPDRVWVDMWRPYQNLHRGTVVAFWSPLHPEKMAVKRVIALPGDVVETRPPYLSKREAVPPGHVWVEGEHPEGSRMSYDSNTYGPVSMSLVVGKVRGVVWPWGRAGRIRWQDWGGSERVKEGRGVEVVEVFVL